MPRTHDEDPREAGGPKLVSFADMARLLAEIDDLPSLSPQRIRQLAEQDPSWPIPMDEAIKTGRIRLFDWRVMEPYFRTRQSRQGQRTDLKPPAE
jgi:hypothetical protein